MQITEGLVGMRIAVDLTALADNFTGIERYAANMALELLKNDERDTFELIFKEEIFPTFRQWADRPNIRVHVLKRCGKLLFNQWRLPRFLNRLKADRYLFLAFPMPVLLYRKHVSGTIHDMGCWDCPETMKGLMVWYFRLSYRWMAKRAEHIITISEFSRNRIRERLKVPEEKLVVAYCGLSENFRTSRSVEKQKVKEKYHLPDSYYLCLSTLEPRKNMLLLLNVYLELCREGRMKTPLVLAGRRGWKIDELLAKARAEESGQRRTEGESETADSRVYVTGFLEDEDLPAVYRMAKCFVFPSIYEGFGIPPLEAMSQGVPVIASDASSIPEVLGDAAIYFRSNDADDLKNALLRMERGEIEDLERRAEEGACRSREFSYEREARKVLAALQECQLLS